MPRDSGPAVAEASRKLKSWGSQIELADKLEKGLSISHSSAADESKLPDDEAISLDDEASTFLTPRPSHAG